MNGPIDDPAVAAAPLRATLSEEGVLSLVLDRPDAMNALTDDLAAGVESALEVVDRSTVRCVVLSGAGERSFSAGADVSVFEDLDPVEGTAWTVFERLAEFPQPTIAKIDGLCLGAGLELALACDLRLATERSAFGQPEIRLGFIPGAGGTQRLQRLIGPGRAKELVYRGHQIDAETAAQWGLVNRAVPVDEFEAEMSAVVEDIAEGPPAGLRAAKRVLDTGADASLSSGLMMESQAFGLLLTTDDVTEGVAAFQEDRDPEFTGQ
jgi:enoyl-CoA hydratase/3-hydroxyacyl-CoA dehydrogenase